MSIKKIAEMTGVSVSTVSRVLSNPNYKCRPETLRGEIIDAARKLDYIPNEAARRLKSGSGDNKNISKIVILITRTDADETAPFFRELLRICEVEVHNHSFIISGIFYRPFFSDDEMMTNVNVNKVIDDMLLKDGLTFNGIVIIGKCLPAVINSLKRITKNIVSINRNSTNYAVDELICDGEKRLQRLWSTWWGWVTGR